MFHAVGMKLPFWIMRDTWGNTIAKVVHIDGAEQGKPIPGRPPYYGNPAVYADFYKIESGEKVGENQPVSCPGTYSYMLCDDDM